MAHGAAQAMPLHPELAPSKSADKPISRARVLLVKLIDAYAKLDYALTMIEIQKQAGILSPGRGRGSQAALCEATVRALRRSAASRINRHGRHSETPYSMELLATVHWVASHEGARSPTEARDLVQRWNEHKKARYHERHVEKAWQRLESEGWIAGTGPVARP